MRFLHYILTALAILVLCTAVEAQRAKLNRAERLMNDLNYAAAIDIYRSILDKGNDSEAVKGIAEAYRRVGNPDETEYWYGMVARMPNPPQKAWLYYAQALQRNGKCEEAKKWAEQYVEQIEPNNTQAMWLVKSCEESVVQDLRAAGGLYDVKPVEAINTEEDEFSPIFYRNDLVFVSSRDRKAAIKRSNRHTDQKEKPYTELYLSRRNQIGEPEEYNFKYTEAEKFSKDLSSKFHDGPITFNAEFSEAYFTRSNMDKADDGIIRLKVYQARGNREKFSAPKSLPFNSDEYSVVHPSLSVDGDMLFFSSDMPGGFGGFDLYVSYLEDGRWSPPVNLGPTVNTEGNETFPFHHESGVLYFASNGLVGLGGMDIYKTTENYGAWTDPVNLGYPINTVDDDFGFILNKDQTHGYFSSNRKGGKGGDDIYTFTKLSVTIMGVVYEEETQMPIEAADVFTSCSDIQNLLTNQDGKFIIELPLEQACDFAVEKLGYQPNSVRVSTKNELPGKTIFVQIPLKLECIFVVSGTIVDGLSSEPIDSARVTIRSSCGGEDDEMTLYTDAAGKYEFRDIREDCDVLLTVSKAGYTDGTTAFRTGTECGSVDSTGSGVVVTPIQLYCFDGDCENIGPRDPSDTSDPEPPFDPNDPNSGGGITDIGEDEQGNKIIAYNDDTRVKIGTDGTRYYDNGNGKWQKWPGEGELQLVNIYYDYDRATIRSDAKSALDDLVMLLKYYPEMKIRLTSHTDARGKKGYNMRLSKRRAEAVVRYLIDHGIGKGRLQAKGMGERVMINDCYDGVICTEEQHQENRRTEFVIIEYVPPGVNQQSTKPDRIRVRGCNGCPKAADVEGESKNAPAPEDNMQSSNFND